MPHYKNGREVKVGDKVVGKSEWGGFSVGTVIQVIPGSSTCNMQIVPVGTPSQTVTTSDYFHVDDANIQDVRELDAKVPIGDAKG